MTSNEVWTLGIAAYAAAVSTFLLGWDAYKWLSSGPKIRLSAAINIQLVGGSSPDPNMYVSATATNLGDRATTITNLGFEYFDSRFNAICRRRKPQKAFIITSPSSQQLPFRFEPGAQWVGLAEQDENILKMIREGFLYVVIFHSHSGKGVRYLLKKKRLAVRTTAPVED